MLRPPALWFCGILAALATFGAFASSRLGVAEGEWAFQSMLLGAAILGGWRMKLDAERDAGRKETESRAQTSRIRAPQAPTSANGDEETRPPERRSSRQG